MTALANTRGVNEMTISKAVRHAEDTEIYSKDVQKLYEGKYFNCY